MLSEDTPSKEVMFTEAESMPSEALKKWRAVPLGLRRLLECFVRLPRLLKEFRLCDVRPTNALNSDLRFSSDELRSAVGRFPHDLEKTPNKAPEPTLGLAQFPQGSVIFDVVAGVAHL